MTLRELIVIRKHSVGQIATAIEKGGVSGWDRFGRFRDFEKGSKEAGAALDALAAHYAHDDPDELAPADVDGVDSPYTWFGWREAQLPEFGKGAAELNERPPPRLLSTKGGNADLRIIGALLLFIQGKYGAGSHPDYSSEAALIEWLGHRFDGYGGLKARNLQQKFADAKRLLGPS